MTVIAGILSFIFWGKLNGVREGTIIAALLVGFIARLFGKHLEFMRKFIIDDIEECVEGSIELTIWGERLIPLCFQKKYNL